MGRRLQVTAPHDTNIIAEVEKITDVAQIELGKHSENITILDEKFDALYLNKIKELSLSPDCVKHHHDMKIVYSPMHGAGVRLVPGVAKEFWFYQRHSTNSFLVRWLSTAISRHLASPNPEERKTMKMAIDLAEAQGADIAMATDPAL